MIRIYSKDALKVNLEEEKSCSKLVTSGSIYTLYVECCDIRNKVRNRVFIVKDNGKCVGWAISSDCASKWSNHEAPRRSPQRPAWRPRAACRPVGGRS